jgi:hypothetical protein
MFGVDAAVVILFVRSGWKGRLLLVIPLLQEVQRQASTLSFFAAIGGVAKHESEITAYMDEFAALNGLTTDELFARFRDHTADTLMRPYRPALGPTTRQRITHRMMKMLMRAMIWPPRLSMKPLVQDIDVTRVRRPPRRRAGRRTISFAPATNSRPVPASHPIHTTHPAVASRARETVTRDRCTRSLMVLESRQACGEGPLQLPL